MTQFARNGDVAPAFDVEGDGDDLLLIAGTASTRALWGLARQWELDLTIDHLCRRSRRT